METEKIVTRTIDELGRVVLPIEIRKMLGWEEKTVLDIYCDIHTGVVSLKPHTSKCIYCGETQDLMRFKSYSICHACQQEITELSTK